MTFEFHHTNGNHKYFLRDAAIAGRPRTAHTSISKHSEMDKSQDVPELNKYLPYRGKAAAPAATRSTCRKCGTKLVGGELDDEANGVCDVCRL